LLSARREGGFLRRERTCSKLRGSGGIDLGRAMSGNPPGDQANMTIFGRFKREAPRGETGHGTPRKKEQSLYIASRGWFKKAPFLQNNREDGKGKISGVGSKEKRKR